MPYAYTRVCPVCHKVNVQNLSRHLRQVHNLSPDERQPYLKAAQYQLQDDVNVRVKMVMKRNNKVAKPTHSIKAKATSTIKAIKLPVNINNKAAAAKNRSKTWTSHSYTGFKFNHPFSMQVVGPTSCGKTHFVRQVLETPELKHFRVEWYYNQSPHEYDV